MSGCSQPISEGSGAETQHSSTTHPRAVRSFVRREGRLTEGQRRAIEAWAPTYCIADEPTVLDLDVLFGRSAERHLEIGCGSGEALLELAARYPENDYLGIEVYRPGLGRLLRGLAERRLGNVRLLCGDAVQIIGQRIDALTLSAVYIFFPDPWPKKRHHKRRLIQPDLAALLHDRLLPHGRVFIATDWEDYALHILKVMEVDDGFVNLAGPGAFAPRPRWRVPTRYERRALAHGHRIRDMVFALSG